MIQISYTQVKIYKKINIDLIKILQWLRANNIFLNTSKTKLIISSVLV